MKNLVFVFAALILILSSCEKNTAEIIIPEVDDLIVVIDSICQEIGLNANWNTEDFKTGYDIQFPDNYEGTGMIGFEGNTFQKKRIDDAVQLSYFYCDGLWCSDYGATTVTDTTTSVIASTINSTIVLNLKTEFCDNGETVGYLFYNCAVNATGKYFMPFNQQFHEALEINFTEDTYVEVVEILKTIHEE